VFSGFSTTKVEILYKVDIRGHGGQVAAPPSVHPDTKRTYQWIEGTEDLPLPDAPQWLIDRVVEMNNKQQPTQHSNAEPHAETKILQGQRDDTLFRLGCSLRAKGLTPEAIEAALLIENKNRCEPPLQDHIVREKARQAAKYQPGTSISFYDDAPSPECPPAFSEMEDAAFEALISGNFETGVVDFGYERNDTGNGQRLVDAHGFDLRYCSLWNKWLVWDGHRWEENAQYAVVRFAVDVAKEMLREAREVPKSEDKTVEKERLANLGFAVSSGNERRLSAMIKVAQSGHLIPIESDRLDQHRFLLNCSNGTLDLKTGNLMPFERSDYITKILNTPYDPYAKCPRWEAFFNRIMDGDSDIISFLQRALGYTLTGDIGEQCVFILYGKGANGKSTMLSVLKSILGGYARQSAADTFMESRNKSDAGYDIAMLKGARFVTSIETREGKKIDEAIIKQITGGDTVSCRRMREDFWEYDPEFKLFLSTNHKPVIKGTDHGVWRRLRLIPFNVRIPDDEKDKDLHLKLLEEAPGILAWCVRGCIDWQAGGLREPDEVWAVTKKYREEMDILGAYLDEMCLLEKNHTVPKKDLYESYVRWLKEAGEFVVSHTKLTSQLKDRGFVDDRNAYYRFWWGIKLNDSS
jgi:putative DNA primase/helicase